MAAGALSSAASRFASSARRITVGTAFLGLACGGSAPSFVEGQGEMSFFITSRPTGDGGNLGGIDRADAHCQVLATAAGAGHLTWRAYLSGVSAEGTPIHARDRIGPGPWFNARGVEVAANLADLHGDANWLGPATSLTEQGDTVPGRIHDILTGSNPDGTWAGPSATCRNWTSRSSSDMAMLGHHDRRGGGVRPQSWNAAHPSQGCSPAGLESTGSAARFYCFAVTVASDAP